MTDSANQPRRRAAHFSTPAEGAAQAQPAAAQRPVAPVQQAQAPASAAPRAARTASSDSANAFAAQSALTTNRMSSRTAQATRRAGTHDVRRERAKSKSVAPIIACVVAALVVIVAVVAVVIPSLNSGSSDTQEVVAGQTIEVTIPDGAGAAEVAQTLFDAGIIANKSEFLTQVSRMDAAASIKSGDYSITTGGDYASIIDTLVAGPNAGGISLTIPEGYTLAAIASTVESTLGIPADQFTAQAKASNYVSEYSFLEGAGNDSLEGFLFPKTYAFNEGATADDVIRTMLNQFQTEIATLDLSYVEERGLSVADMVNLASIVEKESTQSTGPLVAAVFWNRLGNFGDPNYGYLQSDATTAYSVGHDPTAEEVHDSSDPYSTYAYQGLPPTPICNPGLVALQSVCSPDMDYINEGYYYFYFWNDADGNVQYAFSKTYQEHMDVISQHS